MFISNISNCENLSFKKIRQKAIQNISFENKKNRLHKKNESIKGDVFEKQNSSDSKTDVVESCKNIFNLKENSGETEKNINELDIEEFKKNGNFKNGLAYYKDVPYSGVINVENKKGVYRIEYNEGVLKKSTMYSHAKPEKEAFNINLQKPRLLYEKIYQTKKDKRTVLKFSKLFSNGSINPLPDVSEEYIIKPDEIITKKPGIIEPVITTSTKQKDGSWKTVVQEVFIGSGFKAYRFKTDINSGKIIEKTFIGIKAPMSFPTIEHLNMSSTAYRNFSIQDNTFSQ